MGTRAAAFTAKIKSLYDYQLRLLHGIMPSPSGFDIANTVKYFSQTLLAVLKDVTSSPLQMLKKPEMDSVRMGQFPNLDYKGLYNSLVPFVEVTPLIQTGVHEFGQAILQCLGCLLPFLDYDLIDNLPFLTASFITVFPTTLHQEIINLLCYYILPFTITRYPDSEKDNYVCHSLPGIIMIVFQYSKDPAHHCQILECLMGLRSGILKDLLCVVAYGASEARAHAVKLIFYYWPAFDTNLFDKRDLLSKFASNRTPFVCQRENCPNAGNVEAAKVCYDHTIAITYAPDIPPPLYLCIECANEIHREHPNQQFFDILHMMQQVSMICENKNCRANDKSAYSICFSTECASYNGNHPIRYCQQCHNNRHNNHRGGDHIVHKSLPLTWSMDSEMQNYMLEAIISLLREAQMPKVNANDSSVQVSFSYEDRQLLGRYGVWLLVGRCIPKSDTPAHILGRLLSMLFHWFHTTSIFTDANEVETFLEKLKTEHVFNWLKDVCANHYKVFISCLLPHPPEYARVGGHWDALASRTSHIKDGLNRLFCLVPYQVVTSEIWDHIMPYWMEAIVSDVPEKELFELKVILNKILDIEINPLKFDAERLYRFITVRFEKTTAKVQEQALHWLQMLTIIEVTIPLNLLFSMFGSGIKIMRNQSENTGEILATSTIKQVVDNLNGINRNMYSTALVREDNKSENTSLSEDEAPTGRNREFETDAEYNLSCCIHMLDVLLNQLELQGVDKHGGVNTSLCKNVCRLLKDMVAVGWTHVCPIITASKVECGFCESNVIWHQLSLQLIKYLSPTHTAHPPDVYLDEAPDDTHNHRAVQDSEKKDSKSDVVINMPIIPDSVGGVLVHMPHVCSIMTATVETVSEQLDLTAIIPSEKVVSAVARSITLSETDVATATVQIAQPQVIDDSEKSLDDDLDDYWHTSVGKFRFSIDELPEQLQYIYQLLKELPKTEKPDILYYILQCLHILCLYGDAFTKAAKNHFGFFIWCQENILIKNLWEICNAEHSHICEVCVPLLLHCVTLPVGSDVFWTVIQEEFHSPDWRVRFVAVERVTIIARFMDSTPLRGVLPLQAALANAFCYLISSMDDPNVYVAQRATLYLGTIHDSAIRALILCLETQFDSVIVDRPMVLQSLYQLHNSLSDRKILTWEFFLNRFDALFLEAQINLEKMGEPSYLRGISDLRNTDLNSEIFLRKWHRAQEALSQSDGSATNSVKTLSASFGQKWPYKRTMSAPASFIPRQDTKQEKEKIYSRQYSAPILKRRTSRFGLGQFAARYPTIDSIADGHIHSLNVAEDPNIAGFLHRVIDFGESDQETMHLLIFLLMQFLSRTDQAFPCDEKSSSKTQTIVLKHLYLLLGYNKNEKAFCISSSRLRLSPVFNAFLSNLPQLLDQNNLIGSELLPVALMLLQYCPCPYQQPSNNTALYELTITDSSPTYSLWFLESHLRHSWLMSLLVLLYKYQYSQQPDSVQLQILVKIVLKTLDSQNHHCRRIPATVVMSNSTFRSRDVSQPSLGQEDHVEFLESPPLSPLSTGKLSKNSTVGLITEGSGWSSRDANKMIVNRFQTSINASSQESQEIESELMAIPELECYNTTSNEIDKWVSSKYLAPRAVRKPQWFIGSEDNSISGSTPSIKKCMKQFVMSSKHDHSEKDSSDSITGKWSKNKRCSSGSTDIVNAMASAVALGEAAFKHSQQKQFTTTTIQSNISSDSELSEQTDITRQKNQKYVTNQEIKNKELSSVYKSYILPPPLERLLPIGESRSSSGQKSFKLEEFEGSPESPLSKMNIMTLESPDEGENSDFSLRQCIPISKLEIPKQERLLPIGHTQITNDEGNVKELVEKLREALGVMNAVHSTVGQSADRDRDYNTQTNKDTYKMTAQFGDTSSRSTSPRRLIKQVALESPPPVQWDSIDRENMFSTDTDKRSPFSEKSESFPRPRGKKSMYSFGTSRPDTLFDNQYDNMLYSTIDMKNTCFRIGDESVIDRCAECGTITESYSDEELGLCIIILGTFIHREPALAAPLLPDILSIVAKVALNAIYPWQCETNVYLPGGAISVAHQFLRCVLHQLAPNGVFVQMFQTKSNEATKTLFFRSVAQALLDFTELNPIIPLQLLLEGLNSKKTLPMDILPLIIGNMAIYLDCLPVDVSGTTIAMWTSLLTQVEIFFRRIVLILSNLGDLVPLLRIMIAILKMPNANQFKGLLDPFSKILSAAIEHQPIEYHFVADLCYLCNRNFSKERDKLILCRMVVFQFIQAIKFKITIPDSNFLLLITFILHDAGGSLPSNITHNSCSFSSDIGPMYNINISDCIKQHINDILEFLMDFHTLTKLKTSCKQGNIPLNEDTLGGTLKSAVAQYLALEITHNSSRDNRAVGRYLPWLYSAPSALQQGQRDFIEWVGHIRLLSWLLLGSLTHTAIYGNTTNNMNHATISIICQPIPQEASCHIADHIQVIMGGFAEQSKLSVLHMSSLFHAFILCQLWTVYLEQNLCQNLPISEAYNVTMGILFDFWGKVTPCILQLVSFSKVLAEMVNLHFLSMLEALLECQSTFLSKLLPLWTPVLYSHHIHLPGNLQLRLQNCRNFSPILNPSIITPEKHKPTAHNAVLLQWLQRLQFKMGQIELQSSNATQFYSF